MTSSSSEAQQTIIPIKIALTEGDFYTLWAPAYREHGSVWQAFLGDDDNVFFFHSPAELLAYISAHPHHDLSNHPRWSNFQSKPEARVVPEDSGYADVVGVPALLAERPSHNAVSGTARALRVARSLGEVLADVTVTSFFSGHSVLDNLERGSDHYIGEQGAEEWTGVGRVVLNSWNDVVDALDGHVFTPEVDDAAVSEAETAIAASQERIAEEKAAAEAKRKEEAEAADPYDSTVWAAAGIDPVKISIEGRTLYTLRTYVEGRPVFLGKYGEIFTFNNRKTMPRWLAEHGDHDLAKLSTWETVMTEVNGGTLDVTVHEDNSYSFTGLEDDIRKGPKEVDTEQMRRAYELLADAADWAADDSLNSILLARPSLQDYISYMLGGASNYVPDAPFSKEAEGWKALTETLTQRFSKF
ncbi:hypothetical protein [Corynebacterium sp. 11A]|uniref:hypothetical protein n=1 Tax=Corynebacterium sp. 11A TaxID=2080510 RepID=UPI00124D4877|nr:hypothetical protein [Corynebacterium sp. 11A]